MINPENITAFIFAAGLGTRLKPLTDSKPKALVTVDDKALIDIVIDNLSAQGVGNFVVNVHHFASQIVDALKNRNNVAFSDETDLLRDTGGAVKHARNLLKSNYFLVHNVDIISNFSLDFMLRNMHQNALATLLVSERNTSRYLLFNDDMRLVGWTNISTGEVKSPFANINVDQCRKLAFSGIHLLNPCVHNLMEYYPEKFSIIDFYLNNAAKYEIYGLIQPNLKLVDVGKVDSLAKAADYLKEINSK
ncbi:MAG: sugar phosphate nucleotidyltransferase [Candidatus Aphodosoma sp.]